MEDGSHSQSRFPSLGYVAKVTCIVALALIIVFKFDSVLGVIGVIWGVISPLLAGALLAFFLNLIVSRLERVVMRSVHTYAMKRLRRAVCIVLALAIVVLVIVLVVFAVKEEIASAVGALGTGISTAYDMLMEMLESGDLGSSSMLSELSALLSGDVSSWAESLSSIFSDMEGIGDIFSTAVSLVKSTATAAIHFIVMIVFAIYVLADRERVLSGCRIFGHFVFRGKHYDTAHHVAMTANDCFSHFFVGQCIEGMILGCLCALGMKIFGMPYAASIGLCVGVTAIVPLVGAWIGGIVGALMILSVDPIQAVWFVVWLVVLQQIEGHVIYPNVVGTIIRVPGIWVLVAVFVGGTLFGILGIFLGVPLVATCRKLVKEYRDEHDMVDEFHDDSGGASVNLRGGLKQPRKSSEGLSETPAASSDSDSGDTEDGLAGGGEEAVAQES